MTNTEKIWIIVGISGVFGTIGLLVALREVIYRVDRIPVHNRLRRTHTDIELNYIEPAHPGHSYQPIDSVNPNYMNYESYHFWERVPTYYSGQHAPSYFSGGNPPSFNTVDRFNINSCLENDINLDFIMITFLILIFLILIWKIRIKIYFYILLLTTLNR